MLKENNKCKKSIAWAVTNGDLSNIDKKDEPIAYFNYRRRHHTKTPKSDNNLQKINIIGHVTNSSKVKHI